MLINSSFLLILAMIFQPGPGELAPCPDSPNCVNTYQTDEKHEPMQPLPYEGDPELALDKLVAMVDELSRTELIEKEGLYAHFTFKIAVFGFVDDVEFVADTATQKIHFRSASRTGYYDLGVNKSRMKDIQELWEENN